MLPRYENLRIFPLRRSFTTFWWRGQSKNRPPFHDRARAPDERRALGVVADPSSSAAAPKGEPPALAPAGEERKIPQSERTPPAEEPSRRERCSKFHLSQGGVGGWRESATVVPFPRSWQDGEPRLRRRRLLFPHVRSLPHAAASMDENHGNVFGGK